MENVEALVSQKFIRLFNAWQLELESYGYRNFAKVLNAKDYGVPQNRKRIFMVSILNCDTPYYFPKPFPLTKRLKDVLEENVEEEYYLSQKQINTFNNHAERHGGVGHGFGWNPTDGDVVANALLAASQLRPSTNYVCIPTATKDGVQMMELGGVCDLSYPNSETRRGRVQEGGTVAPTLTCGVENALRQIDHNYRIRKLTERECFRLMGVTDENSDKIRAVVSKSQCYKMAGNSIVVACLYYIFDKLFIHTTPTELTLF